MLINVTILCIQSILEVLFGDLEVHKRESIFLHNIIITSSPSYICHSLLIMINAIMIGSCQTFNTILCNISMNNYHSNVQLSSIRLQYCMKYSLTFSLFYNSTVTLKRQTWRTLIYDVCIWLDTAIIRNIIIHQLVVTLVVYYHMVCKNIT